MTDLTEAQVTLEQLTHKNHAMTRLKNEFRDPNLIAHIQEYELPIEFTLDLLAQMVIHRKAKITVLVGLLHKHFNDVTTNDGPLQTCCDMILKAARAHLIDWEPAGSTVYVFMDISDEVKADLARYQYPMPMLVEPQPLANNRDSGYLTTKSSVILKNNHTDDDVCLDHINRMNAVPLAINHQTSWMIDNCWSDLDRQKEHESLEDYAQRVLNFRRYTATAYDVMEHIAVAADRFWITHKYDKRGRSYCQGYHVNPQGNDWNKAVIELADKETLYGTC